MVSAPTQVDIQMIAIITSIMQKLPLAFLERWLSYLEKKNDTDTARLRDILSAEIEAKKLQTQIVIAEQGWWVTAMIRPLFAWPIAIYVWKIVVWDKVLGWGTTDPLSPELAQWSGIIITAYFIGRPLEKGARAAFTKVGELLKEK